MDNTARAYTIIAAVIGAIIVAAGITVDTFHPGSWWAMALERAGVVVCVTAIAIGLANEAIGRGRG